MCLQEVGMVVVLSSHSVGCAVLGVASGIPVSQQEELMVVGCALGDGGGNVLINSRSGGIVLRSVDA